MVGAGGIVGTTGLGDWATPSTGTPGMANESGALGASGSALFTVKRVRFVAGSTFAPTHFAKKDFTSSEEGIAKPTEAHVSIPNGYGHAVASRNIVRTCKHKCYNMPKHIKFQTNSMHFHTTQNA
jgi:hypothetical protein